jgi:hypothetical protein
MEHNRTQLLEYWFEDLFKECYDSASEKQKQRLREYLSADNWWPLFYYLTSKVEEKVEDKNLYEAICEVLDYKVLQKTLARWVKAQDAAAAAAAAEDESSMSE